MPRNHNLGTSTLRNRNRVTNKTRLKVVQGSIDADPLVLDEDEEKARIVSTAGVDAEDANEHHLQAVLSAASHRHQSVGRTTRGAAEKVAAPTAFIPTPDSTGLVDSYADLYPPNRWTQPDSYIRSSETVEESCFSALIDGFAYYMDERDKEWLDRNNEEARGEGTSAQGAVSASGANTRSGLSQRSAKAKGKEPESAQPISITEDEFELVMGIFEKVTHDKTEFLHHGLDSGMAFPPFADYHDTFSSPLPSSMFATFIVPSWIPSPAQLLRLAKAIYPYWRERRTERGGHRIIPTLNFDETDTNESYICFRRREIKAVRKTRASQATSSDKLLRLQSELVQSLELAKTLLARENLKKDNAQQTMQVWEKRFDFVELKRKLPSLGTKDDEELLHDKERVVKKPRMEAVARITGLKLRARDSGDPGSPALSVEASIRPKERLSLINAAIERDLTRRKERDHGYEDVVENPYQRPTLPFPRRHWKSIPLSSRSSPSTDGEDDGESRSEHIRYLRRRFTRLGGTMIDRRDAFMQRLGIQDDSILPRRHGGFGHRLIDSNDDDAEIVRRLRERWRFDQDDDPSVGPEGAEEQDRVLIDDYDPKYLRHMMTLLTDHDQQFINNDATLLLVSSEGRQQTVVPFRTGGQQPFIRRDPQVPQRVYTNGVPQITTPRQISTSLPLSAIPNGVPISMQTNVKAMQPPSGVPHIRSSSNGVMRPPSTPATATSNTTVPPSQPSPPQPTTTVTSSANGPTAPTAPAAPDGDAIKLNAAPGGTTANGSTPNGPTQQRPADTGPSPVAEQQQPTQQVQAGSPARPKAEVQQPVSIPLNGYHVPINGYTISSTPYLQHPRQHNLSVQQIQNLKMALAQGQDVNAAMHAAGGRPMQTPYVGHLVPNSTHLNMQMGSGASVNLKVPPGRQWNGVVSPLQQAASLGNQQDGGGVPVSSSPHTTPGVLPTRTPSANGNRSVSRPGNVNGVPSTVGHMMPGSQYAAHSLSPHMQQNSPLISATSLPSHQSPPRPPPTPTMKMASPSIQHQQVVPSSQGGY
ncbi:enhancer of polycomb-like-domain-containing protein [Phlebopus sp. FC_14]|nr:enhancer of polycomb-like-domain-containing protein [Phlebopus sp. FC_14]